MKVSVDVDPFSTNFLLDPYPWHRELREASSVVWLPTYRIYAAARHHTVHGALSDWRTFGSAAGVGLSDFRKEKPWRPPSLLLEADPPLHTRTRGVVTTVLSRRALGALSADFKLAAQRLVDQLLERRRFDAIRDLAEVYPVKVFPDAVGIEVEGRENLLPYGAMAFNAFGPRNELFEQSMREAARVTDWIASRCRRQALRPGGFGAKIFESVDAGTVSEEEAALLVRSLLTAGVDTTVNALGNAMVCLTRNPQSFQRLRDNPSLARSAFEEVIRYESPVQTFFRTTLRATSIEGVDLPEGEKILLFLGAANRDPRRWDDADSFDVTRNAAGHVGFGSGIHGCIGQLIARLEGELVLSELAMRVSAIHATGTAVPRLNNTLRGWSNLPVEIEPA